MSNGKPIWWVRRRGRDRNAPRARSDSAPAGVAVVAAPTIDTARGLLYVATGDSVDRSGLSRLADAVVALSLARWQGALVQAAFGAAGGPASDSRARPMLRYSRDAAGKMILAGQRSGIVYGLDPERAGEVLWQTQAAAAGQSAGRHRNGCGRGSPQSLRRRSRDSTPSRPVRRGSLTALDTEDRSEALAHRRADAGVQLGTSDRCAHARGASRSP